tara:strand:- start:1193 stop:1636 length:444 start_codon:yes stop_codon:yes gene_type:complete
MKQLRFIFLIAYLFIGFYAKAQIGCLYINSLNEKDTLYIFTSVVRERYEEENIVKLYKRNEKFYATIKKNKNEVIRLNQKQLNLFRLFELNLRNQSLEGDELLISGSMSRYELVFKNGQISFSSRISYFDIYKEILGYEIESIKMDE